MKKGFLRFLNAVKGLFLGIFYRLYDVFSIGRERQFLYIGGSETLPRPLTQFEEAEIISGLKTNPDMRYLLIEHNLRLVVYIAKKFENTGIGTEDLISIGTIGLIKAINTFDPDKNIKLATYASRCIENEILMHIRKNSSHRSELSIDEPLNVDNEGNELHLSDVIGCDEDCVYRDMENEEEKKIIRRAVSKLSKREQLIIDLRFGLTSGEEMTQKEVADLLMISQSYISRLEKRIIDRLRIDIGSTI